MANFPKTPHHSPAETSASPLSSPLTVPSDVGDDPFISTGPAGRSLLVRPKTPLNPAPTSPLPKSRQLVADGRGTTPAEKTALRTGAIIEALESDRDPESLTRRLKTMESMLVNARAARKSAEKEADHEREARVQVETLLHESHQFSATLKSQLAQVTQQHETLEKANTTLALTNDKLRALLRESREDMATLKSRLTVTEAKFEKAKHRHFEQSLLRERTERAFKNERRLREDLEASLRPANSDEEDAESSRESNYPPLVSKKNIRSSPESADMDVDSGNKSSPGWFFDSTLAHDSSSVKFKGENDSISAPVRGVPAVKGSNSDPFSRDDSLRKIKGKEVSDLAASTSKHIAGGDYVRTSKPQMVPFASSPKKTIRFASPRVVTANLSSSLPPLFPPRSDGIIDLSQLPATDEENSSFEAPSSASSRKRDQVTAGLTPQSKRSQRPRSRVKAIKPAVNENHVSAGSSKVNFDINCLINALSNAANSDPSLVAVPQSSLSHKMSFTKISSCSTITTVDPIRVGPSTSSATTYSKAPTPPLLSPPVSLAAQDSALTSSAAPPVVTTATVKAEPQLSSASGAYKTLPHQTDEELEALVDKLDPEWTTHAIKMMERSSEPAQPAAKKRNNRTKGSKK